MRSPQAVAPKPDLLVTRRHGRYTVKGRGGLARAFLEGGRQGAGVMAEATAASTDAAIAAVIAALDARDGERNAARRMHATLGLAIPTRAEYAEALAVVAPTTAQRAMLKAHAAAGAAGLSANDLADAAGYRGHAAANLQYGLLGRAVAETLGLTLPDQTGRSGHHAAICLLAEPGANAPDTAEPQYRWVIHPELAEASATLR